MSGQVRARIKEIPRAVPQRKRRLVYERGNSGVFSQLQKIQRKKWQPCQM